MGPDKPRQCGDENVVLFVNVASHLVSQKIFLKHGLHVHATALIRQAEVLAASTLAASARR